MKKEDQNTSFQLWLAAYNQRLIEVAGVCTRSPDLGKSSSPQSDHQDDPSPPGAKKPAQKD